MIGNRKLLGIILFLLLVGNAVALFPVSQALSWALSVKNGAWTVKAFDALIPGTGQVLSFVTDPQGTVLGASLGQLKEAIGEDAGMLLDCIISPQECATQVTLEQIAKQNPGAFGVLSEVLAVKAQLQELGFANGNVELDNEGNVQKISEVYLEDNKVHAIGNIVGKDLALGAFKVANVAFSKEDGLTTIAANKHAQIKVKGKDGKEVVYTDMKEGSVLKFDEKGELVEADIQPIFGNEFKVGEQIVAAIPGKEDLQARIQFKNGIVTLTGKKEAKFNFLTEQEREEKKVNVVHLMSDKGKVEIAGEIIRGKDFTWEEQIQGALYVNTVAIEEGGLVREKDGFVMQAGTIFDPHGKFYQKVKAVKPVRVRYNYNEERNEGEAILRGEDVLMESQGRNFAFSGAFGIASQAGKYKLYAGTDLKEVVKEEIVTSFRTSKDLEVYTVSGYCGLVGNCLETTKERIVVHAARNANVFVDNPGGTIREVFSRKITDESVVQVKQGNVNVIFSQDPFKVEGMIENSNLEKVESEYIKGGKVRIVEATVINNEGEKYTAFSDCPPCDTRGQGYEPSLGVRVNALNVNRAVVKDFIDESRERLNVRVPINFGYFDDAREKRLVDAHLRAFGKYDDIDPSTFVAIAFQEGEGLWVDRCYYNDPECDVHGYGSFGLDLFGEDVDRLKKKGFLDSSFNEYEISTVENEQTQMVDAASFPNVDAALEALGATIRERKDLFIDDYAIETNTGLTKKWNTFRRQSEKRRGEFEREVRDVGEKKRYAHLAEYAPQDIEKFIQRDIKDAGAFDAWLREQFKEGVKKELEQAKGKTQRSLSKAEIDYGTYVYYNTRPSVALRIVQAGVREKQLLPNEKLEQFLDPATRERSNPKYNAMRVVLAAELFERTGLFDTKQQPIIVAKK